MVTPSPHWDSTQPRTASGQHSDSSIPQGAPPSNTPPLQGGSGPPHEGKTRGGSYVYAGHRGTEPPSGAGRLQPPAPLPGRQAGERVSGGIGSCRRLPPSGGGRFIFLNWAAGRRELGGSWYVHPSTISTTRDGGPRGVVSQGALLLGARSCAAPGHASARRHGSVGRYSAHRAGWVESGGVVTGKGRRVAMEARSMRERGRPVEWEA